MTAQETHVGVIGGGAWGTALAILANRAGSRVTFATRNENVIESIRARRTNDVYLPSVYLDPAIAVTEKITEVGAADIIIIAVPSHVVRSVCIALSDVIPVATPIILASKGVERGSLLLMSEVLRAILPHNPMAIISGPNFAEEAARGLPTATALACTDAALSERLIYAIGGRYFRPYVTTDIIGAQIGGAVKNVIAIACGIALGKGFGENARAAIVTRGFAEMVRLAVAKGAKPETLMGLSGLGDVLLTCGSPKSRNMSFGMALGQGRSMEEILAGRGRTATEGVVSAESVSKLARKHDVEMPICDAVYRILYDNIRIEKAIGDLLERPFTSEI